MSTQSNTVELFTLDEHAVLAKWLGVAPPSEASDVDPNTALQRLGFEEPPTEIYSQEDAAVAFIVLESIEHRLPQWGSWGDETGFELARKYRDPGRKPDRDVVIGPQHLFTINWADSGPGYSWPVAYHVSWVPIYERFVVTASADTPETFGYADFALGSFERSTPIQIGTKEAITRDWRTQYDQYSQASWAYLFGTGLISPTEANAWADEVWGSEGDRPTVIGGALTA